MSTSGSHRDRRVPIRVMYDCQIGPLRPSGRLYCDNASSSFPKPGCVTNAMVDFAVNVGSSAGRGAYRESRIAGDILLRCRRNIVALLNAEGPEQIVFTMNCSDALNLVIHGLLNTAAPGAEVIVTALEHNSVLRPLEALKQSNGVQVHVVPCDPIAALVNPEDVRKAITPKTKLIVCCHVSNVTGTIQPVADVCRVAREAGIPCLIDAAQAAGHVEIDVRALGCDFLAFPGHKGLLGPLGTGGLYIRPGAEKLLYTIKEGGTGSQSELMVQPEGMPERFEIGSHNVIGIAGLAASTGWLLNRGIAHVREHDKRLIRLFMSLAGGINHLTVHGPRDAERRVGVFSVNVDGMSPGDVASALEARGILTRAGLHCAPLAHQAIGTFPAGACRISFGPFMREDHVRRVATALFQLAEGRLGGKAAATAKTMPPPPEDQAR
jgi:cysteine desulfurase family protein